VNLNLQLTTQTKILIGVLAVVLIAAVATQWGPGLYGSFSNKEMKNKQQTLQTSKDLVAASEILKPIETDLYQKTGLSDEEKTTTIFDGAYAETVIREKIDAIVKKAGIPQNYQLNLEQVPGKKSEKISTQARRNLVVYFYQKKLETERDVLKDEIEAEFQDEFEFEEEVGVDEASMDMLMAAWLDETDEDDAETPKESEKPEKNKGDSEKLSDEDQDDSEKLSKVKIDEDDAETPKESEKPEKNKDGAEKLSKVKTDEDAEIQQKPQESYKNQNDSENSMNTESQWGFASMPESIPSSMRLELIELIISMIEQHLVGAEKTLFENEFYEIQKQAASGFFGIGAKKPKNEINFNPNSQILTKFTGLIKTYGERLDEETATTELLKYLERIQSQIAELSQKLQMAPTSYLPESYTVKMKFKAEIDKLVNLNRLIETTTKWLMVRDLQISVDNKDNKINVDVLMIARVYQ